MSTPMDRGSGSGSSSGRLVRFPRWKDYKGRVMEHLHQAESSTRNRFDQYDSRVESALGEAYVKNGYTELTEKEVAKVIKEVEKEGRKGARSDQFALGQSAANSKAESLSRLLRKHSKYIIEDKSGEEHRRKVSLNKHVAYLEKTQRMSYIDPYTPTSGDRELFHAIKKDTNSVHRNAELDSPSKASTSEPFPGY